MKIIVGLGNPGVHYRKTRHNVGFQVVDQLASIHRIPISTRRFQSLYGRGSIDSLRVVLLKPLTYMNRSGESVKRAIELFHPLTEDLIVIHDDLDLPFGRLRFKKTGGDGGHQGLRSIIESTGGSHFIRLKVGIGRPPSGMDPAEFVLAPFREEEQVHLDEVVSGAAEAITVFLLEGMEAAMNRYQKKMKLE